MDAKVDRRRFVLSGSVAGAMFSTAYLQAATDVRTLGVVGDGMQDNTEALRRALQDSRGALFFPAGVYRFSHTLTLDLAQRGPLSLLGDGTARLEMTGPGPLFHILGTHEGSAFPDSFEERVWNDQRMPLIAGIEIRGLHEDAIGICLEKTVQATLSHVLIHRCKTALHLIHRNRNLIVAQCHFYHNAVYGILFDRVNLHQVNLVGNHISYNAAAGITLLGGEIRNMQIVGNDIEYNHSESREGSSDILIDMREEGSSFREGTITGNTIQAVPTPGGANVRVLGGNGLFTGGLMAITGNLIGSQTETMHLADCRGVTVSGNSLYSGAERTLRFERCHNLTVGNNTIDWNPDHKEKKMSDGIRIVDCHGVTLSGVILENCFHGSPESGGAIEIEQSEDITLSNCQILDPRYRGIVLHDAFRCRVDGCTILDRRKPSTMLQAIHVTGQSRDNWIGNNLIPQDGIMADEGSAFLANNVECSNVG